MAEAAAELFAHLSDARIRELDGGWSAAAPATPRQWLEAVEDARLSPGARLVASYMARLPSFPHAFFSLRALSDFAQRGACQTRRYLRELEEEGLLGREASFGERWREQRSNDYWAKLPENYPGAPQAIGGGSQKCEGFHLRRRRSQEQQQAHSRVRARGSDPSSREHCSDAAAPSDDRPRAAESERKAPAPQPPARPKAVSRPAIEAEGLALDPALKRALCALPGGLSAARVLARAALAPEAAARVVARVLEVDRQRGIDHAGKFIHGPIADERAAATRQVEQGAAERHDDWELAQERIETAVAAQRIPIFIPPPPKPVRPRTKLEEQRDTIVGTLLLPAGFVGDERRLALERELAEVEAALRSRALGS